MAITYNESWMIPLERGQAVGRGWPGVLGFRPLGVTWHWTVTRDLKTCRHVLGGANAERKGEASAHYGVGRSFAEGVDRYVSLENRSWHAGKGQKLAWNGEALRDANYKGSRSTIGVETVTMGYATAGMRTDDSWISAASPDGREKFRVQPWTEEQVEMMVEVGKEIVARWPHIRPDDHHGHHDICAGYKVDVVGFPFARVLRAIYDDPEIEDVWSPLWTVEERQRALIALGYDLGGTGADGDWGRKSAAALRRFQSESGLVVDGMWTVFVNRAVNRRLRAEGKDLRQATRPAVVAPM